MRMQQLRADKGDVETEQINWKSLKDLKGEFRADRPMMLTVLDWRMWLVTFMYFCNVCMVYVRPVLLERANEVSYGMGFFLPTILLDLGYTGLQATIHSARKTCTIEEVATDL